MIRTLFLLLLIMAITNGNSQNYQIGFEGTGATTFVDSVVVQNLMQETSAKLYAGDVLQLEILTAIEKFEGNDEFLQVYPNPMEDHAELSFFADRAGIAEVIVYDINGKKVLQHKSWFSQGIRKYRLSGLKEGVYIINVSAGNRSSTKKIISQSTVEGLAGIAYTGTENAEEPINKFKNTLSTITMPYTPGDRLLYKGFSGNCSTIIPDIPTASKTITFSFVACTDSDSNNYSTVQIGDQVWMAENLKTTSFNDGQPIPNVVGNFALGHLTSPAYCWGNNDPANKDEYGGLYNWFAVNSGKLAPTGWHVPTETEFRTLADYLGGVSIAGGKMKSTTKWQFNVGATNESGFSGNPVDYRNYDGVIFWNPGGMASYWSSTDCTATNAIGTRLSNDRVVFDIWDGGVDKKYGYSIRCIKD